MKDYQMFYIIGIISIIMFLSFEEITLFILGIMFFVCWLVSVILENNLDRVKKELQYEKIIKSLERIK